MSEVSMCRGAGRRCRGGPQLLDIGLPQDPAAVRVLNFESGLYYFQRTILDPRDAAPLVAETWSGLFLSEKNWKSH